MLFCDIVGSTPLTERLGPEAMRDLVSSFLEASLAEVHRYGGTAPQFTGDGFMALFGAPVTQEDHVRRALLAAVAIQRALRDRPDAGEVAAANVPVRMGIHTGPVVFGPVSGGLRMDYTAIGDTANVAARLQEAAEPGTILVSETTRRLAQGFARVEPVGPLALKGKEEPIVAYRLLGVSHRRSGLRETVPAHTTTFVDRESERAILHNFLRQVENGHSQAVGIVGEPGIGKSRLARRIPPAARRWTRHLGRGAVRFVRHRNPVLAAPRPAAQQLRDRRDRHPRSDHREGPLGVCKRSGMDAEQDSPVLLHLLGIEDAGGFARAVESRSRESEGLRDLPPA